MSTRHRKFAKAQLLNEGLTGETDTSALQPILASLNVDPIEISDVGAAAKKVTLPTKRKDRDEAAISLPKSSLADIEDSSSDDEMVNVTSLLRGQENAAGEKKRKVATDSGLALPYVAKYSQQRSSDSLNNKFPYWNDDMVNSN